MVHTLQAKSYYNDKYMKKFMGKYVSEKFYTDGIVTEDTDCYWVDSKGVQHILFIFRKHKIPTKQATIARTVFEKTAQSKTTDRGFAGGVYNDGKATRMDGKMSRGLKVHSFISGYFDKAYVQLEKHFKTRNVCRTTQFTQKHKEMWKKSIPFLTSINNFYKKHGGDFYKRQKAVLRYVPPGMSIGNTVFSTVTTNYNWRTAVHTDKGDFKEGLGNLTVVGNQDWSGCYLGFPRFKIAVDVRPNDVILMDSHQHHGNTELYTGQGGVRLSFVCYLRENMQYCNTKKILGGEIYYYHSPTRKTSTKKTTK